MNIRILSSLFTVPNRREQAAECRLYNHNADITLEAYESGQLKLSKLSKKEIAAIKAAALNLN